MIIRLRSANITQYEKKVLLIKAFLTYLSLIVAYNSLQRLDSSKKQKKSDQFPLTILSIVTQVIKISNDFVISSLGCLQQYKNFYTIIYACKTFSATVYMI